MLIQHPTAIGDTRVHIFVGFDVHKIHKYKKNQLLLGFPFIILVSISDPPAKNDQNITLM